MPTLCECFDLIRVINLPERLDRRREVEREIAKLGLAFSAGKIELFNAQRPSELSGFRTIGSHGCFQSHLGVLRDARSRGVHSVLVMEDDCEIPHRYADLLAELAATLNEGEWGFAYLGHVLPPPPVDAPPVFVPFAGPLQTTHLYAVHHTALSPLIDYLEACLLRPPGDPIGGPMDVDGAITMFRAANPHFRTLVAQPSLASQRSSRSDITYKPFERYPGVKQLLSGTRKLKAALRSMRG